MKDYLTFLNEKYPIIIVTMGTMENLILKTNFIKQNINSKGIKTKFFGLLSNLEDKSKVNLERFLFVDDNQDNLNSSNAMVKILFENRKDAEWNKDWNGIKIQDISEILKYFDL